MTETEIQNSLEQNIYLGILLIATAGITFSAWAGILKDKSVASEKKKESVGEFDLVKGMLAAVLVKICRSEMALGFEQAIPISNMAETNGVDLRRVERRFFQGLYYHGCSLLILIVASFMIGISGSI